MAAETTKTPAKTMMMPPEKQPPGTTNTNQKTRDKDEEMADDTLTATCQATNVNSRCNTTEKSVKNTYY